MTRKEPSNEATCRKLMMNDRLSELPEDILLKIMSYFTLKEVLRTSVVSRKWKHMCRFAPVLEFEDEKASTRMLSNPTSKKKERAKFIRLVYRVLGNHLAPGIDHFKIKFNIYGKSCQKHIDRWVGFTISRQVKKLEVDLDRLCTTRTLCTLPMIDSVNNKLALTSLILKCVDVTGEQIRNLLLCCPLLENLSIQHSDIITSVSICGLALPLKHLEISFCRKLEAIDITAPKLLSFVHISPQIVTTLRIFHAPLLSKVCIRQRRNRVKCMFESLWKYFSQLEEFDLTLDLLKEEMEKPINLRIDHVPSLPNLKHLTLYIAMWTYQSCLGWAPLIEASPVLEKLSLEFECLQRLNPIPKMLAANEGRPLKTVKTLELRSIPGRNIDLELVSYVLKNAIVLEDVIVNTPYGYLQDPIPRAQIVELEKMLPPGVKLTIN